MDSEEVMLGASFRFCTMSHNEMFKLSSLGCLSGVSQGSLIFRCRDSVFGRTERSGRPMSVRVNRNECLQVVYLLLLRSSYPVT
jgi:hypothetical protein